MEIKLATLDQNNVGRVVKSMLGGRPILSLLKNLQEKAYAIQFFESLRLLSKNVCLVHEKSQ
jgi:hypothetical protein